MPDRLQEAPAPVSTGRALQPGSRASRGAIALGAAGIALACFAAYGTALTGDFVWDDDTHLLDNPVLEPGGLYAVWLTPPEVINYWPVTFTTYWIEHQLWGLAPLGYHVTNVLLHALACLLVWRVLERLGVRFAWWIALVFAVHPVNVESVAWITQRKNVLSLLFFAWALLGWLRFERTGSRAGYAGACLAFVASLLSKGAGAPLPAVLLLLAWWQRGRVTRTDVMRSLPLLAIAAGAVLLELSTQQLVAGSGTVEVRADSWPARLAGSGWVWWFYLWKALAPLQLIFVYPRWSIDASRAVAWLPLLGVVAVHLAAWWRRAGWGRPVLAALLYFGLMLSPVLGFVDIYYMRFSFVADHYQYLALVGVVALAVGGLGTGLAGRVPRKAGIALGALAVALLCVQSARLSASYTNAERLWRDTIAKNPDAFLAHYNLAHLLQQQGRLDEAADHYRERLRIDPDYPLALNNLGVIRQKQGRIDEALDFFRRAVASDPEYLEAHNNLAVLLAKQGDREGAIRAYQRALQIEPDSAAVHYNLALVYEKLGRLADARAQLQAALRADPQARYARKALRRLAEPSRTP